MPPAEPRSVASERLAECLVVAPLARELRPFVRRIGGRRLESSSAGSVFGGHWAGSDVLAAVVGDGAARARHGLERLIVRHRPRRMLLIGVAGGLSPGLAAGDLIRASRVVDTADGGATLEEWVAPGSAAGDGTVVAADRIVGSSAGKLDLWRRLGEPARAVVDLESAVFARLATAATVEAAGGLSEGGGLSEWVGPAEWAIIRAVSDPQTEDLPLDFAAASDAGGHVVGSRVARQLLARPGAAGALSELRRRVALCAERLAAAALRWIEESTQ